MPKLVDLTGKRFGRLLAIKRAGTHKNGFVTWLCRCDCGKESAINGMSLRQGWKVSCGCLTTEQRIEQCVKRNTTHGKRRTRAYNVWAGMRQRCSNKKLASYEFYGARGIKVCERWESFENFYADMGEPPTKDHSIERVDNDGPYSPENCRWATKLEQSNNRRSTVLLTFNGTTKTLKEWSRAAGMSISVLAYRVKKWGIERALSTPPP